jgi:rubrerythrin
MSKRTSESEAKSADATGASAQPDEKLADEEGPVEIEQSEALEQEEEDEKDDEDDDDDRSDADVLIALGELDAEAAQAYRIVAASVEDPAIRSKLEEFADDQVRHVETINRLLSGGDTPEISVELDEGSSAMTMLAAAVGGMGDHAALLNLIGNEQLTNSAYPMAMELPFEEEIAQVLARHTADQQRHLQWLIQQEARVREAPLPSSSSMRTAR